MNKDIYTIITKIEARLELLEEFCQELSDYVSSLEISLLQERSDLIKKIDDSNELLLSQVKTMRDIIIENQDDIEL